MASMKRLALSLVDPLSLTCINLKATEGTTGIWQNVELNLSIIVTCLPTFPSLISHWRKGPRSASRSYERSDDNEYKKPLNNGGFPGIGNSIASSRGSEREQKSTNKACHGSSYNMDHLGPVYVQTDVRVKRDGESHHSSGSIV